MGLVALGQRSEEHPGWRQEVEEDFWFKYSKSRGWVDQAETTIFFFFFHFCFYCWGFVSIKINGIYGLEVQPHGLKTKFQKWVLTPWTYDFSIHEMFESIREKRVSTKLGWSSQVSGQLLKLTSTSWCFSFLPSHSRRWCAPRLLIRSSLLLSQSSASSYVSHELLDWLTRRQAEMEEELICYFKGVTCFPSLTPTPTSFLILDP